jgi:hypothetical protein
MSISWDENQLTALAAWISDKLPLEHGEVIVASMDIPENCFAGQVDLDAKEFVVFTNVDSSMADTTVNIFLGYIVAMAYDKVQWSKVPEYSMVVDCHRSVCSVMLEFNDDFAKALEENLDVVESWYESQTNAEVKEESLVEDMGSELFTEPVASPKNYNVN